jgi:hypothetical protein
LGARGASDDELARSGFGTVHFLSVTVADDSGIPIADVEPRCRNCGAAGPGAFCPSCGQETRTRLPTLREFMREAAGRLVAFDGKSWRTLWALMFRPGFLTREYLAGRRRRYVRPARLFLVASLLLFAALRMVVELGDVYLVRFDSPAKDATQDKSAAPTKDGAPGKDGNHANGPGIDDDFNVDLGVEIPALKKRIERFRRLNSREREAQITDGMLRYGPYAMFVLLPAFAVLLKLLYLGRSRTYPGRPRLYAEHMVFAAHTHAFLFLAIIAANVVSFGPLRAAVIAWMLVYGLWSLRAVYGGSWLGIAARSFVMFVAYSVLFGLVTAGLVVIAVLLR